MARVQIATQSWGVLQDRNGDAISGVVPTLTSLSGVAASVYTTGSGTTLVSSLASDTDGRLPGYVEEGTYTLTVGGTAYTVEATAGSLRSQLPLNVQDSRFGTADPTGATSSQAVLEAAVAEASSSGRELYFAGTYLSTATIPNFHDVRKRGPGVVKRGTSTFAVEPGTATTNIIYCAPGGDDANDGLTTDAPRTLDGALDALDQYGPVLRGQWRIQDAGGVGSHAPTKTPFGLRSENRLQVWGVDVGGHPNVPTSVIACGTSAWGIWFSNSSLFHLKDWYLDHPSTSLSGSGTAAGVVSDAASDGWCQNVHGASTDAYAIVNIVDNSRIRYQGGILTTTGNYCLRIYNSLGTVGYNATSLATGPQFTGGSAAELIVQHGYADCFWINFGTTSSWHANLVIASRVRFNNCDFRGATDGNVKAQQGSHLNLFQGTNTFDRTDPIVLLSGHSTEITLHTDYETGTEVLVASDFVPSTLNTPYIFVADSTSGSNSLANVGAAFYGDPTSGSNVIAAVEAYVGGPWPASLVAGVVGQSITGTGIPVGATISAIDSVARTITISANATATNVDTVLVAPNVFPGGVAVGDYVARPANIPIDTTITAFDSSAKTITLSANATGSATAGNYVRQPLTNMKSLLFTIPLWFDQGKVRLRVLGSMSGDGRTRMGMRLNSSELVTVPSADGGVGSFVFEADMYMRGLTSQFAHGRIDQQGQLRQGVQKNSTLTLDGTQAIRVYAQNTGDTTSMTINALELYVTPLA